MPRSLYLRNYLPSLLIWEYIVTLFLDCFMPPIEDNTENQHEETVSYTVSRKSLETIARCNSEKQVYTCIYIYIYTKMVQVPHTYKMVKQLLDI